MLTRTLVLQHARSADRSTAAWFIPGGDPEQWLCQMAVAGLSSDVRIHVVPASASDRAPLGALVVPRAGALIEQPDPRWRAYACRAKDFFLPVDGAIVPPVSDDELRRMLSDGVTYVFHPVAGLVAYDSDSALTPDTLLTAPPRRSAHWDRTKRGIGFARRLTAVILQVPLDLDTMMEDARDDIGTESPTLKLPKSPHEPKLGQLLAAGDPFRATLARMVLGLTQLVPRTALAPTWINTIEDWANSRLARQRDLLETIRHREILRLMHLLDSNPDEGLRYALPIDGDPHRGLEAPGSRLARRLIDFTLGRHGGPADVWNISPAHRQRLTLKYRELATRELALGRYRRAAYIFANLLHDYGHAASALEQGAFYREAAAIHKERLRNPSGAARCLERGGLLAEAIKEFEAIGDFETVGDLHARLGEVDSARDAYRTAVQKKRVVGDSLEAARLLETKLHQVDDAIEVLAAAWPDGHEAGACLRRLFETLGRIGRHDESRDRVKAMNIESLPLKSVEAFVDEMARLAVDYPTTDVQTLAADRVRLTVAGCLESPLAPDRRRLVRALARLVPADRLLERDCHRFLRPPPPPPPPEKPRPRKRNDVCELVSQFRLPPGPNWRAAISMNNFLVAAGTRDGVISVIRANWNGESQSPLMDEFVRECGDTDSIKLFLARHDKFDDRAFMVCRGIGSVSDKWFKANQFFSGSFRVDVTSGSIAAGTVGVATSPSIEVLWLLKWDGAELALSGHSSAGQLLSSRSVLCLDPMHSLTPELFSIHARPEKVYVGVDHVLFRGANSKQPETMELPARITSLVGSAPHSRPRVAAMMERGVAMIFDNLAAPIVECFARDIETPVGAFTAQGWFIIASANRCEVYRTQHDNVVFKASADLNLEGPLSVLTTDRADRFAIVDKSGHVAIYDIPTSSDH